MHTFRIFFQIIKYLYRARFEYPGAWLGGIFAQWFSYGISMATVFLMVGNFGTLAGWLPAEILFMYAGWLLSYAIGASFTFNICMNFQHMAIQGTMDEAYTRPMPPFLYLIATTFNIGYVSHITLAGAALIYSMVQLSLSWVVWQWMWFFVMIISGGVITACMILVCEMPSLYTRSKSLTGVFFDSGREFAQYPLTIYPCVIQVIFTTILPFGFVGFYPSQVLIGKHDGLLPQINMWLAPIVASLLVGITALCWRVLSRNYESAGT
jgi:ABC-2 type transport system permease protein